MSLRPQAHSGYIPMQSEHFTLRLQAFFTFHSGYIPIGVASGALSSASSLYIPPLCQVLDTYFFQISNPFSTSILTATPDFSRDY